MKKLIIKNIDGFNYLLEDNGKLYNINIEFYDIQEKPKINDSIFINEELLKEKILNFGSLNGKYGKSLDNISEKEIIVLNINNKNIYLKRYYG